MAAGKDIGLAGRVGGDVKLAARRGTVSSRIDGNLAAATGDLRLASSAAIAGDLTYWNPNPPALDPGAEVGGVIAQKTMPEFRWPGAATWAATLVSVWLFMKLISFVSTLILGFLLLAVFPTSTQSTILTLRTRPWASLVVGGLALVATPVAVVLLLATVVAAPLGVMLAASVLVAMYLVRVLVMLWIGQALLDRLGGRTARHGWALLIGVVVYFVLTFVPFIGGLLALVVVLLGLGAAILTVRGPRNEPNVEPYS